MLKKLILATILALLGTTLLSSCAQDSSEPAVAVESGGDASSAATEGSPGDHVSFFVIGKSWTFDQNDDGKLTLNDMGYFSEIFKIAGGEVTDAWMQLQEPGSEPIPFDSEGDAGAVLYGRKGTRHQELAPLDEELPNGDYAFRFNTPSGDIEDFVITLSGPGGGTDLPPGPVISLSQNGEPVSSSAVAPGVDTLVSWTPFATGRADPNGIADDLIFVMMKDCHGERAFHSGRPLDTPNPLEPDKPSQTLLTYADNEVAIPGDVWQPGTWYQLDVEHARLLDTDKQQGVVGMSTYAVTTHLRVQVAGESESDACPSP